MTKQSLHHRLTLALATAGAIVLAGCSSDEYALDEVDATIGIGSDSGITLPNSSTSKILMEDVLEVDPEDCIEIRANGDYVFTQQGSRVEPSHPEIDKIHIVNQLHHSQGMPLVAVGGIIDVNADIDIFDYAGEKPKSVVEVWHADTDGAFDLTLYFPSEFAAAVSTIEQMTVELPPYLVLDQVSNNGGGEKAADSNLFTFTNLSTNRPLTISANVVGLEVNSEYEDIEDNGDSVKFHGAVHVSIRATASTMEPVFGTLTSRFTMDAFDITGAEGYFDPDIDLTDMGSTQITGVPEFLQDASVVVDLHNPQVYLTLESDLAVTGWVGGVLHAYKNGRELTDQRVVVPEFSIAAGGTTQLCICSTAEGIDQSLYKPVVVPNLSNLIRTIPDEIRFEGEGRIDRNVACHFVLGHPYNVAPKYHMEAPLSFDSDAVIVHTETIDDWHSDISDYELTEDAYIELTGDVTNNMPAFLTMTANAIDVDGRAIPQSEISVEVSNTVDIVQPSTGGIQPTTTPLTVTVRQRTPGAMKRLDGIELSIRAAATHDGQTVTGVTLNAHDHYILVDNIKVKLMGRVIADMN